MGGSRYEQFAKFSHLLGHLRLQFAGTPGTSGWIATTVGAAASDSARYSVQSFAAELRLDRPDLSFTLSGAGTSAGGAAYADLDAAFRHVRPGGWSTPW
jgi:hypothetical protein